MSSNGSGNNGSDGNGGDGNGQSGGTSDGDNGAGGSDEKGDSLIVDIDDISFEEDEFESVEFDETADAAVIEYEKQQNCKNSDGNWQNGKCLCTKSFTPNQYIECVQDTNAPTITPNAPVVATASTAVVATTATNSGTNIDGTSSSTTTSTTSSNNLQQKSGDDNTVAVATQPSKTQQSNSGNYYTGIPGVKKETEPIVPFRNDINNDENEIGSDHDIVCEEDGPDYQNNCVCTGGKVNPQDGSCSCPNNQEPNAKGSCPKTQQRQVTPRSQQKPTAPRVNTTNGRTTNNNDLSKQDMSKDGTFGKGYSVNGECEVYQKEANIIAWWTKSTSWCNDLYKGEWKVKFDYGLVRGKSACSINSNKLGNLDEKTGPYCWCKVIQYTPNEGTAKNLSLSWVYEGTKYKDTGGCLKYCAQDCAESIRAFSDERQKMFNAK